MTDRLKGLTVVLDKDYRDDDAEAIINAIRMIKGVLDVSGNVVDSNDYIHQIRIRYELSDKLRDALK